MFGDVWNIDALSATITKASIVEMSTNEFKLQVIQGKPSSVQPDLQLRMLSLHTFLLFLQTGEDLIDGNHYAAHEIEARIEALDAHWETLNDK